MANEEHLAILHRGIVAWNQWREDRSDITPDLMEANLSKEDLSGLDLSGTLLIAANLMETDFRNANLSTANLSGANLSRAILSEAILSRALFEGVVLNNANLSGLDLSGLDFSAADLTVANLSMATLNRTNLSGANLSGANLTGAFLSRANLSGANLTRVSLKRANLSGANLSMASLDFADLSNVYCGSTSFADVDLSAVVGLETVKHYGPSFISIDTLFRSKGKIPDIFLRGCGIPEDLITFLPSFLNKAIEFYSCFISYSHDDAEFARRLHDRLQGEGIRCWLDEHQLNPGDQLYSTIYEAIRVYDKVLLCCSETSLQSWWVEKEFGNAINKEEAYRENVLIPLNLDGYLFTPPAESYITNEIKKRLAADFTNWKDHDGFETAFKSVVKALRTDGGKLPPPEPKLKPKR